VRAGLRVEQEGFDIGARRHTAAGRGVHFGATGHDVRDRLASTAHVVASEREALQSVVDSYIQRESEMSTPPNHQVEATAPRAGRLVRHMFYNVIVPGGAALPGAVPHLSR
jgi:hypothetical protein